MFLGIESSSFLQRSSFWCILKILNSHIGSDPLKGVNQRVPPPEKWFLRILSMFLRIETSSFLQRSPFWCNLKILNSHIGSDPLKGPEGGKSGGTPPEFWFLENTDHLFEDIDY